ncbi:gentisate 1,2-dioxygenase (plasmid) [Antarctobacter heliothermus]|uniref:Gentisate 1,2-dioxygenase n=1 Tax=Antarctobacter heliothermus TaxID=74033 RepID=A0A222EBV3_9RHOB|nr:gentisate 1,2-dioxygenase [Antarctobacter heliothermus]ASP23679.1 gentisate 1,2-dioxygenase [Antarctobacter heliothermus]
MSLKDAPELTPEREEFYGRLDTRSLTPLWTVLHSVVTPEPKSDCRAHMWRYDDLRTFLVEAGSLITAKEAERRVLVLENPGLRGKTSITTDLYAGLQLVTPGERAPAHRHTQSALRLILEAEPGAHTTVNGERTQMSYGDFIITPPWGWHDHGNDSDAPVIWLDGLDLPMVSHFDASFAEEFGEDQQPVTRESGDSLARYAANMLPVGYDAGGQASPVFNYPYDRARGALEKLKAQAEIDPCQGIKLQYVNPIDGGPAMPTIATFLQLLPKSFKTAPYRSTDATVYVAVEGSGRSRVGDEAFDWGPRDIFVVPSWKEVVHEVADEAVLFSFSDRAAQQKLGLFRERRGNS